MLNYVKHKNKTKSWTLLSTVHGFYMKYKSKCNDETFCSIFLCQRFCNQFRCILNCEYLDNNKLHKTGIFFFSKNVDKTLEFFYCCKKNAVEDVLNHTFSLSLSKVNQCNCNCASTMQHTSDERMRKHHRCMYLH